jgi:hypothetical protein
VATFNRTLWRLAGRVAAAYASARTEHCRFSLPESTWEDAHDHCVLIAKAEIRGWRHAVALERRRLGRELERLNRLIEDLRRCVEAEISPATPSTTDLYEELVAANDEFGDVHADDSELWVVTEPVILEGIRLGAFEIRLNLRQLDSSAPYRIVALDPNPASSSDDTTHPHVSNEQLCSGEGRTSIASAIREGRLFDLFTVVDRVLHTYAAGGSPTTTGAALRVRVGLPFDFTSRQPNSPAASTFFRASVSLCASSRSFHSGAHRALNSASNWRDCSSLNPKRNSSQAARIVASCPL